MPHDESLKHLHERYQAYAWEALPVQVKQWVPEHRLRAELVGSIAGLVDRTQDRRTAAEFRAAAPVAGTTPMDYLFKVVRIDRDKTFLAGVRFRQAPLFTFVEIYARDFRIENVLMIAQMRDAARRAFKVFSPAYLRVHVPADGNEAQVVAKAPGKTDFITVAGLISALQSLVPPPHMEHIHLSPAQPTEFYDRYVAEYKEFHQDTPHLKDLVPVTPLDRLEQCMAQGLLYEAYVDGHWAGVAAAREATDYGMRGYRVVEEILSSRFRGQGRGPALQRHFIDKLPADEHRVLHGAIDPANLPSITVAKRVGRIEVMYSRFVVLECGVAG